LVLNIGARKGKNCPDAHWVYLPKSKSGFFRVGFYSNVTKSFLPANLRNSNNFVSIYVEKSYPGGKIPTVSDQEKYSKMVVKELQELGFIEYPQVLDRSWVEVAYTWSWPNNKWREKAIEQLKVRNILQIGRYGSWKFQGIADSIRDGLSCKGAID
jgi:hypothetical protein